jgi:hypothetical protein
MKYQYISFLKNLLVYTLILGFGGFLFINYMPKEYVSPALPYLFFFFFSITLIVHLVLLRVSEKKSASFINFFMLLTFGKLLFFLTIILVYALLNRTDAVPFIISFFVLYVFYTAFEVALSLRHTIPQKKEN